MSEIDLDRLGDVWRQQPDPGELEALRLAGESVHRRARWRRVVDLAVAISVTAIVLLLVLQNPKKETVVVGACAIFVLYYSQYRQRRLREAELRSLAGSAEDMIDQSISRIETTLRNHRTSLIGIGPAFLVALLFSAAADRGGTIFASLSDTPWFRIVWIGSWLGLIASIALYLLFAIRRARTELARLNAMRDAYRREDELADC